MPTDQGKTEFNLKQHQMVHKVCLADHNVQLLLLSFHVETFSLITKRRKYLLTGVNFSMFTLHNFGIDCLTVHYTICREATLGVAH